MTAQQTELSVIVKAKDLASYLFAATQKSPKHFRFSLVGRIHNVSLEIIGELYRANDTWVDARDEQTNKTRLQTRLDHQHNALTCLKELDYLLTLSREMGALLPKQQEHAAFLLSETQNMLGAWINSDRRRYVVK